MRKNVLRLLPVLLMAQGSYAAILSTSPTGIITDYSAEIGSGDFHFYYYGYPVWQWTLPHGGYTGVDFDPTDNLGDTWPNSYEVVYVDSLWGYDPDGDYEITLYICPDDGGGPDFDGSLYSYGPYVPDTSNWDSREIDPPVPFYGGEVFWVLFSVEPENGRPISDGDGNSGHSWICVDAGWELMMAEGGVDWVQGVYADELEIENVATESFGGIKVMYQ